MPDGRLVSAGFDGSLRLWDIESRQEVARFSHGIPLKRSLSARIVALADERTLALVDPAGRLRWMRVVEGEVDP